MKKIQPYVVEYLIVVKNAGNALRNGLFARADVHGHAAGAVHRLHVGLEFLLK
jgi:hypothetical protein